MNTTRPRRSRAAAATALRARAARVAPAARLSITLTLALACLPPAPARAQSQAGAQPALTAAPKPAPMPQRIVREGVAIELNVEPSAAAGPGATATTPGASATAGGLKEGGEAVVTFRVTEAATGQPLSSLRPAAWIDRREAAAAATTADAATAACRGKIQSFLQSSLSARPDVDLNTFYILALNQEPNISVIDPQLGLGTTKLLTLVLLKSPGADWVLTADQRRLFVSMPNVNQVAVVDPATWKVLTNIDTGARPGRVRLQPDGQRLWVAYDGLAPADAGGVTVIDTDSLKVIGQIETGAGAHDLALSADGRTAFVTNRSAGTVTVIDAARLAKVRDIKTGPAPASVAYSQAARSAYVADEADGSVVSIDPARPDPAARIRTKPGVVALRFAPDGRHGFVVNRKESAVHVFDAATNRLLHSVPVGQSPDQVAFTKQFAYVRSLGSEQVTLIRLGEIGKPSIEQSVTKFPGGQTAPQQSPHASGLAPAMTNAPEDGAMLVANPADQMIYYYSEGMAAPMGSFRNYRRQPVALQVWDASLRETSPGVYRARARLTGAGAYDVAFLLDSPRVTHCFDLSVAADPALAKKRQLPIKVESLLDGARITAGKPVQLRFKVTDAETGRPKADLKDMGTLAFLSPGIWQQRDWARHVGEGVYEVSFTPPQSGVYYVFFQCPSLGVALRQLPHLILTADNQPQPARPREGARP
ncbi:MAG TPA: cytochrome D1 domain-containing protein [Pyrinomonadaceae bacterium]|nr:cytochrome D1 domain-containing protein [Pyrinomonadaceae bacterium]